MALWLAMFVWLTIPTYYLAISINYSVVLFLCLSSIMVFSVIIAGWSSNSKYSLIGALRSVAQSVSYESVFSTLIVLIIIMSFSYSIRSYSSISSLMILPLLPLWIICTLAETHRAPFDFSEAESELVSGFNTEYSGAYFAFLFLSEYAILLYSCILISYIFLSFILPSGFLFIVLGTLLISYIFIWIRITFCRFRYDMLIIMSWKTLLPLTLCLFLILIPVVL